MPMKEGETRAWRLCDSQPGCIRSRRAALDRSDSLRDDEMLFAHFRRQRPRVDFDQAAAWKSESGVYSYGCRETRDFLKRTAKSLLRFSPAQRRRRQSTLTAHPARHPSDPEDIRSGHERQRNWARRQPRSGPRASCVRLQRSASKPHDRRRLPSFDTEKRKYRIALPGPEHYRAIWPALDLRSRDHLIAPRGVRCRRPPRYIISLLGFSTSCRVTRWTVATTRRCSARSRRLPQIRGIKDVDALSFPGPPQGRKWSPGQEHARGPGPSISTSSTLSTRTTRRSRTCACLSST